MPDVPAPPPDPGADAALAGWRVDDAADQRRRRAWLARSAAEGATVAGLLLDAAERGEVVALGLAGGDRVVGRAWSASPAVVAVRRGGDDVLVAMAAVATVALQPGATPRPSMPTDRGAPGTGRSLTGALASLVADRPRVAVRTADGRPLAAGELVGVGVDVATVATEAGPVHVALGAVATVSWQVG